MRDYIMRESGIGYGIAPIDLLALSSLTASIYDEAERTNCDTAEIYEELIKALCAYATGVSPDLISLRPFTRTVFDVVARPMVEYKNRQMIAIEDEII